MGMAAVDNNQPSSIDPEMLSRVVREVFARLAGASGGEHLRGQSTIQTASKTNRTAASIDDRLIAASAISRLPAATAELFVPAAAVLTPSARDEARRRGITINRGAALTAKENAQQTRQEIVDNTDQSRAAAVAQQLSRRGITVCGTTIILSDTPARELYDQVARQGQVAVMVGSFDDVHRFANELDATVWVLDMKRLNLTAAVNVAAQISKTKRSHR